MLVTPETLNLRLLLNSFYIDQTGLLSARGRTRGDATEMSRKVMANRNHLSGHQEIQSDRGRNLYINA